MVRQPTGEARCVERWGTFELALEGSTAGSSFVGVTCGLLHGESAARLAYLRGVLEDGPAEGLTPLDGIVRHGHPCAGKAETYYLLYFGLHQPARITIYLPESGRYVVESIDTWNMSAEPKGEASGTTTIDLPGRPYIAVVARRVD